MVTSTPHSRTPYGRKGRLHEPKARLLRTKPGCLGFLLEVPCPFEIIQFHSGHDETQAPVLRDKEAEGGSWGWSVTTLS